MLTPAVPQSSETAFQSQPSGAPSPPACSFWASGVTAWAAAACWALSIFSPYSASISWTVKVLPQ